MTQGAFEKDDPTASSPSRLQPRHRDNDSSSSKTPPILQYTPSDSPTSSSPSYRPFQTVTTPKPNSHEPFIQQTPQAFELSGTNLVTEQLPQIDINAPEWGGTSGLPSTVQYGTDSYLPSVPAHENYAFCGFNDTVSQQQQPYIWSQQDFTPRSTPTISPRNLNLQSYQDYFESPSLPSSEPPNASTDNELPSSSSPTSTTPIPPKQVQKSPAKTSKRGRPTHNMVEKQYRMRLNAHFDELLAKIPKEYLLSGSNLGIDRRSTSKTETLAMAEHYIKALENDEKKLLAENKELRSQFETLKAEWTRNGGLLLP